MSAIQWLRERLSGERADEPIERDLGLDEALAQWGALHRRAPDGLVPPPPRSGRDPIVPRSVD